MKVKVIYVMESQGTEGLTLGKVYETTNEYPWDCAVEIEDDNAKKITLFAEEYEVVE